eukprot:g58.t1
MQEQEPAGICDEMHLAPTTFCFYQEKQARFSQGGSPCRWIDMGELIDSGVGGKVDPWTNEDGPDFPLDASGPGQAFPRGSVDLSFQQVFMVDQDGPSSSARNTQLVVMLEPAKDVGGASLKRAKICSVAKLRDLHSTMQGGDAPVNASNGVAQAQAKRDQLTSGLTPTYADIAADDPLFKTCALLRKRNSQIKTTHKDLLQVLREVGLDPQMQQDPHEAYIKLVDRLSVGHHLGELEVKTNFTCDRCQSASSSLEKLSPAVLSLAIPHNGETTLASCLSLHCQDERVERKCDNCSNKTASKKIEVRADPRKLPGVFVLHIKRFRGQGLTADRGHFTALVRNMEGKWFHVDDSKVEPWSPEASSHRYVPRPPIGIDRDAYMLFCRLSPPARTFGALETPGQHLGLVLQTAAKATGNITQHKNRDESLVSRTASQSVTSSVSGTASHSATGSVSGTSFESETSKTASRSEQQQRRNSVDANDLRCHCNHRLNVEVAGPKAKNPGLLYFSCIRCDFFLFKKDLRVACKNPCSCPKPRAAHVYWDRDGTFELRCNRKVGRCTFESATGSVSQTASQFETSSVSETASPSARATTARDERRNSIDANDLRCHCDGRLSAKTAGPKAKNPGLTYFKCGRCDFFLFKKDLRTLKKRPCDRDSPSPSPVSETASKSATGSVSQTATGGSVSETAAQSNESQVSKKRKREDRDDDSSASSKTQPRDDASSASPQTAQKRKEQQRLQSSHPRKAKPSQPLVGPPPVMPQGRPTANIEGTGLTKTKQKQILKFKAHLEKKRDWILSATCTDGGFEVFAEQEYQKMLGKGTLRKDAPKRPISWSAAFACLLAQAFDLTIHTSSGQISKISRGATMHGAGSRHVWMLNCMGWYLGIWRASAKCQPAEPDASQSWAVSKPAPMSVPAPKPDALESSCVSTPAPRGVVVAAAAAAEERSFFFTLSPPKRKNKENSREAFLLKPIVQGSVELKDSKGQDVKRSKLLLQLLLFFTETEWKEFDWSWNGHCQRFGPKITRWQQLVTKEVFPDGATFHFCSRECNQEKLGTELKRAATIMQNRFEEAYLKLERYEQLEKVGIRIKARGNLGQKSTLWEKFRQMGYVHVKRLRVSGIPKDHDRSFSDFLTVLESVRKSVQPDHIYLADIDVTRGLACALFPNAEELLIEGENGAVLEGTEEGDKLKAKYAKHEPFNEYLLVNNADKVGMYCKSVLHVKTLQAQGSHDCEYVFCVRSKLYDKTLSHLQMGQSLVNPFGDCAMYMHRSPDDEINTAYRATERQLAHGFTRPEITLYLTDPLDPTPAYSEMIKVLNESVDFFWQQGALGTASVRENISKLYASRKSITLILDGVLWEMYETRWRTNLRCTGRKWKNRKSFQNVSRFLKTLSLIMGDNVAHVILLTYDQWRTVDGEKFVVKGPSCDQMSTCLEEGRIPVPPDIYDKDGKKVELDSKEWHPFNVGFAYTTVRRSERGLVEVMSATGKPQELDRKQVALAQRGFPPNCEQVGMPSTVRLFVDETKLKDAMSQGPTLLSNATKSARRNLRIVWRPGLAQNYITNDLAHCSPTPDC